MKNNFENYSNSLYWIGNCFIKGRIIILLLIGLVHLQAMSKSMDLDYVSNLDILEGEMGNNVIDITVNNVYENLAVEEFNFTFVDFQQNTVKGNVTDSSGIPLLGVGIIEKGTSNGVVSDFDGNY